jgi:hypothetical protein
LHPAAELYRPNTTEVFLTKGVERRPGALQRNYRYGGGGGTLPCRREGVGDVDDKTWDDAFSKLAKALTGRKETWPQ